MKLSKPFGFTLIELMISIAVFALILYSSVPPLIQYFQNTKIQRVASDINTGLQQTLTEAIKRNELVQFNQNNTGWTITVPSSGAVLKTRPASDTESNIVVSPATSTIGFNSQGRTSPSDSYTIIISGSGTCVHQGGEVRCRQVIVSNSGKIKLCDPALASTHPNGC